jgi:hypothetical protein
MPVGDVLIQTNKNRARCDVVKHHNTSVEPSIAIWRGAARPTRFVGCGAPFTLQHALGCKCGGLVIFRHNEIKDELVHMSAKAFTPSAVRDEPLIRHGRVAEREKTFTRMHTTKELRMMAPAKTNAMTSSFEVFGHETLIAFLMFASLTRTRSLIVDDFLPKSWKHTKKRRNESTSGLAWRDVGTSHLSSVL